MKTYLGLERAEVSLRGRLPSTLPPRLTIDDMQSTTSSTSSTSIAVATAEAGGETLRVVAAVATTEAVGETLRAVARGWEEASDVPYLTSLDLSYNSFSGPIPVNITQMTSLNTLNLEHNQLSGEIPWEPNLLTRLSSFNVADNLLSGPIPSQLQKFWPSSFAGNEGLCGAPLLDSCPRLHRINEESIIGAAVGFVVGFEVPFYFPQWFPRRLRPYIFWI
ncbi:hypothetical protein ABZP36_015108 [Zizania latifolia]